MQALEQSLNDILAAVQAAENESKYSSVASLSHKANSTKDYKRKYQDLLKRFHDLQRDQEDTFSIHADTVIQLQDKIKEKERLLKRGSVGGAESDAEMENGGGKKESNLRQSKTQTNPQATRTSLHHEAHTAHSAHHHVNIQSIPPIHSNAHPNQMISTQDDDKRLIEILKTKVDIMRISIEETSRQYEILQQRDQETIAQLSYRVKDLESKLEYSANQVSTLTATTSNLKIYLKKLLDGVNKSVVEVQSQKQRYEAQLQEMREIYVSETQAGIEKTTKINDLHSTINDKNREISILRDWLGRIKRDLRDRERKAAATPNVNANAKQANK